MRLVIQRGENACFSRRFTLDLFRAQRYTMHQLNTDAGLVQR